MKSKIFTLCLLPLLISSLSFGKIRRVGYSGSAIANTDYSDLQSAHDAASANDSIYLYPGSHSATLSKKLIIIGYGYFINGTGSNSNLQAITGGLSADITLSTGSDGTKFEGLDGLVIRVETDISVNSISINRCNISDIMLGGGTCNNWLIGKCYISSIRGYWGPPKFTNLLLTNSFIDQINLDGIAGQSGLITNNIFHDGYMYFGDGSFILKNNLFVQVSLQGAVACTFQNNVNSSASNTNFGYNLPAGNGNVNNAADNSLFVGYPTQGTNSHDGRWALKTGSPAIGAGEGGTNCGIFGGSSPYKLSGIPTTPSFYKLTAPSTTASTNPYTITFSVRSNN